MHRAQHNALRLSDKLGCQGTAPAGLWTTFRAPSWWGHIEVAAKATVHLFLCVRGQGIAAGGQRHGAANDQAGARDLLWLQRSGSSFEAEQESVSLLGA